MRQPNQTEHVFAFKTVYAHPGYSEPRHRTRRIHRPSETRDRHYVQAAGCPVQQEEDGFHWENLYRRRPCERPITIHTMGGSIHSQWGDFRPRVCVEGLIIVQKYKRR